MRDTRSLTSGQVRAARALLRWDQKDLVEASGVSIATIKRLETMEGLISANRVTIEAILRAFVHAGIDFIAENEGSEPVGGPGVRLATQEPKKGPRTKARSQTVLAPGDG